MVLEESGIDPERYALEWVSSAEAPRFAEVVTRFTEQIRALGPHAPKPCHNESPEMDSGAMKTLHQSTETPDQSTETADQSTETPDQLLETAKEAL
ncbi:hypothetical protein MTBBW1_2190015 [Desulfamplus magnetovallimortis]|uniref:F420-non-reducing hydrogenase iron-sulfur subunit D domain-containing protein n=1 Tax=Desulfamplus magnetovallimortis TaxID=1246637 RepID=A0A1W1HD50_9BACT|nr:hypothetical protein MTBBW1_2190015 [Desulfamplus magnetovallimortis]